MRDNTAKTVASVDLWRQFTPEIRESFSGYSADEIGQVHGRVTGSKGSWLPLRPLFLDKAHHDWLGSISWRLMELILDACRRRAGTVGELIDVLRVPSDDTPLLRPTDLLGKGMLVAARPDIVYSSGTPKFVEVNIDGAIGGTQQSDFLADGFCDLFQIAGRERNLAFTHPGSSVDARFAVIRSSLGLAEGDHVVIPVFSKGTAPGLEDQDKFLEWLVPMCEVGRRHGLDTAACRMDDLVPDATGALRLNGRRVDAGFRLFQTADQPPSPGIDALVGAVRANQVRMHTTEATWLLTDKTTLAWLWSDREQLATSDRELIETYVPRTALLCTPGAMDEKQLAYARAHRTELVLKPSSGYGGAGVVIGPSVSEAEWEAALTAAAVASHPYVIQEFATPDEIDMDFVHAETGVVEQAVVPFVMGPFLFDGKPSGVLVRHGVPNGGPVLNASHGARMNAVVLVDTAS